MTRLDAIADPVRLALVRFLEGRAASAREIADGIGVHLNTARSHLKELIDLGVVLSSSNPGSGRGRPVVRYRIRDGWRPVGDELLGLAQLISTALGRNRSEAARRARRWGRERADRGRGSASTDVEAMLSELGFEASVGSGEVRLANCPCPLVSPERPAEICRLVDHALEGSLEDRELRAGRRQHDPASRRCCIELAPA